MKIKVSGSDLFQSIIPKYHEELVAKIYARYPEYKKLNHLEIKIVETSNLETVGTSKFTTMEMLINHQLTRQNPKFLYEVYAHELAHFFSTLYFNTNIQHNQEWVDLMECMGLPARPEVSFSVSQINQLKEITIKCGCYFGGTKKINRTNFSTNSVCKVCHQKYTIV